MNNAVIHVFEISNDVHQVTSLWGTSTGISYELGFQGYLTWLNKHTNEMSDNQISSLMIPGANVSSIIMAPERTNQ